MAALDSALDDTSCSVAIFAAIRRASSSEGGAALFC